MWRQVPCRHLLFQIVFHPRPRVGGDQTIGYGWCCARFQSTPPRGGRHRARTSRCGLCLFQSTPPRGGRPSVSIFFDFDRYFNPRPRVGGDGGRRILTAECLISIHAPAWGATRRRWRWNDIEVFQSTPPRGGRLRSYEQTDCGKNFNPRPRVGGDPFLWTDCRRFTISIHAPAWGATHVFCHVTLLKPISIHAPAWGATIHLDALLSVGKISIHAPAWGGDVLFLHGSEDDCISIHAPAWGATTETEAIEFAQKDFNPRPRVGGDRPPPARPRQAAISIHAPAWGATGEQRRSTSLSTFQSTPPRGGRPRGRRCDRSQADFNPRPRVGGDEVELMLRRCHGYFNPRPRVGGDPVRILCHSLDVHFNPRPRVGGDPC